MNTTVIITQGQNLRSPQSSLLSVPVSQGNGMSAPCVTICGRYILRSLATSPLQGLFSEYLEDRPLSSDVTAATPVTALTYEGQTAYEFTDANGNRIYVSRSDYPYPIAVVSRPGNTAGIALEGTTRFSQWNAVPTDYRTPPGQATSSLNAVCSSTVNCRPMRRVPTNPRADRTCLSEEKECT